MKPPLPAYFLGHSGSPWSWINDKYRKCGLNHNLFLIRYLQIIKYEQKIFKNNS